MRGALSSLRVVLVHDWLTGMRGGEQCLDALVELLPQARIHTLIHTPGAVSERLSRRVVRTSFLQRIGGIHSRYRSFLPLFPLAVRDLRVRDADLVISVSHAIAKAVWTPRPTFHLCYCLTPMRYLWDRMEDYLAPGRVRALGQRLGAALLRRWDRRTGQGADAVVAISRFIAQRVQAAWRRPVAGVIPPPVRLDDIQPTALAGSYYLVVSALVPYKRVDLAIEAVRGTARRLIVVGGGPLEAALKQTAPPNVQFERGLSRAALVARYQGCRALIHPAVEDFGIAPVEALAAGRPVVARRSGGALDYLRPIGEMARPTGVFFDQATVPALRHALDRLDAADLSPAHLRQQAERFSRARFLRRFRRLLLALPLVRKPADSAKPGLHRDPASL